ncbi:MAG: hypothetical protein JW751_02615 [Polyangiaceae bacterium]|nr:hypothetical protein [Polyangiaceae bacterium]
MVEASLVGLLWIEAHGAPSEDHRAQLMKLAAALDRSERLYRRPASAWVT